MGIYAQGPAATTTTAAPPGEPRRDRYTGVAVIHGIGDERRNDTLLQALNALSYWFNHHAGLDLEPEGAGRVWLTTELRDDQDPDTPASRATLELVAPSNEDAGQGAAADDQEGLLRLEFREVWWAESFGLPPVGPTLRWARVQWREQFAHLLLPIGIRLGPAETARRAPAREIAQALTYLPEMGEGNMATPAGADGAPPADPRPTPGRLGRAWGAVGLWLYDLVQYLWKLAQWLVLIPLISPLLLLLGLVRLLARIPFLQSSLIAGATATINYLVLHWVASVQVYLLDYARSSVLRQRFEHEVESLLADPRCERVVVIAHSMGTVISYEGLTTLLRRPEWRDVTARKPITYICLAQALRRVWLASRTDPERLHAVLPEGVRWLHFWARYDPVAVGPLDPHALPPLEPGATARARAADAALRARLKGCENVDVVNTDSIFADHTTYWENVEQVVGPIARELVAGHPTLERLVSERLATRREVVRRRWGVAWRALVSLAGGFGAAAALVALDARNHGRLGTAIAKDTGQVLGSPPVQQLLSNATFGLTTQIGDYLKSCARGACSGLQQVIHDPNLIVPYLLSHSLSGENVATAVAALVVVGLGVQLVGALVAAPSPFAFRGASPEASATRSVFVFAALSLLCGALGLLVFVVFRVSVSIGDTHRLHPAATAYLWAIGLAELALFVALGLALVDAVQGRRWGWVAGLAAGVLLVLGEPPVYAIIAAALALVGCLALWINAARRRRWGWAAGLGVVALPLAAAVADLLHPHATVTFGLLVVVAPLAVYGIWAGRGRLQPPDEDGARVRVALGLSVIFLLLSAAGGFIPSVPGAWVPLIVATTVLGTVAWGLAVTDATRTGRWGWAAGMVLLTTLLIVVTQGHTPGEVLIQLPSQISLPTGPWLVWSLPFVAAALSYGLWAGPATRPLAAKAARRRLFPALPVGTARAAGAGVMFALVASLLAWEVSPQIATPPARLVLAEFAVPNASSQSITAPGHPLPFTPPGLPPQSSDRSIADTPASITAGPDGALWFTEAGADRIGRITPAGAVREFALPGAYNQPGGITAGPDGALWFTEAGAGRIGRITPAGAVREFALPSPYSGPDGIAAGPDGALWFTEWGAGQIGRITPSGAVREFALPDGVYSTPLGIAAGPGGAMWFTDAAPGRIGHTAPSGDVREFASPGAGSAPQGITAGPDGALWFTEWGAGRIGRITPAGAVREFALPGADSAPDGIAAGPDGAIWFTEWRAGRIGRITPSGAVREFALPGPNSRPYSIAAGPDGAMWFTDVETGRFGRITPKGAVREIAPPGAGNQPVGIAADQDGALWFTEWEVGGIGRITPAGTVREFLPSGVPEDIAAGPDGALWFTEAGTGLKIGRFTPSRSSTPGTIQEFPLPSADSRPESIAVGPDGNLWFTEAAGRIGRITPAGTVREFALPSAGSLPDGITAGPDGALWFTDPGTGRIGRITPKGAVREFALPNADSLPCGIAAGPDGAVWFTEYAAGRIGRITPAGAVREFALTDARSAPLGIAAGPGGTMWFTEAGTGRIGRILAWLADLGVGAV